MDQKAFVAVFPPRVWVLVIISLLIGVGCAKLNLEKFRELARNAVCADTRNELFLIDKKLVFWHRQGNCPDNSFAQILYGKSPEEELCSRKDSIAGPQQSCENPEFQDLFQTILDNLDEDDLGLSPDRKVEPISF